MSVSHTKAPIATKSARVPLAPGDFRRNNFDLIRLLAAAQVLFVHAAWHLDVISFESPVLQVLERLPGVPIFFFVSGLLISRSFETNSGLEDYARNRGFRIFPALWVCFALSVLSVALTGYFRTADISFESAMAWIVAQMTIYQPYSPAFMDGYGVGNLNGSLWTVTVELQFYVLVPFLYFMLRRLPKSWFNPVLLVLIAFFMLVNVFAQRIWAAEFQGTFDFARKLLSTTFLPWVYMFLIGIWVQRNFEAVRDFVQGKWQVPLFLLLYIGVSSVMVDSTKTLGLPGGRSLGLVGNRIDPVSYLALVMLVMAVAYNAPNLAQKILQRNDISYGVYIYHMPVVNLLIALGIMGTVGSLLVAIIFSLVLGICSWLFVEQPCLKLKRNALNPLKAFNAKPVT